MENINSNKQDILKFLPSNIQDLIEMKATRRMNITELNAVIFRLDDVKDIISTIITHYNILYKRKFKKSIKGAAEYYGSIELYEDRLKLRNEFESKFEAKDIVSDREIKFYRWIRDNKL